MPPTLGRPTVLVALLLAGSAPAAAQAPHGPPRLWTVTDDGPLRATDTEQGDAFARTVAVHAGTLVVGAQGDDDRGPGSGSVYVFEDGGGGWTQVAKLTTADGFDGDRFGESVAVWGGTIAVGAPMRGCGPSHGHATECGAVYLFERDPASGWIETQKLVAADGASLDWFGWNVALDGDTLVVGAYGADDNGPDAGAAYVFERDAGGVWIETRKLIAPDGQPHDWFGNWVSVSGDTALIGVYNDGHAGYVSGSAHVFRRAGGSWTHEAKLTASDAQAYDHFGVSVSISGDVALIGAHRSGGLPPKPGPGAAFVFERHAGTWQETARLAAPDGVDADAFGCSVAIAGGRLVVGARNHAAEAPGAGAAYLFRRTLAGGWSPVAAVVASDAGPMRHFSHSVSIGPEWAAFGVWEDCPNPAAYVLSFR